METLSLVAWKLYNDSFYTSNWKTHYLRTKQFTPKTLVGIDIKDGKNLFLHKYHIKNAYTVIRDIAQEESACLACTKSYIPASSITVSKYQRMWAWSRLWPWALSSASLSIIRNRKSPLPCEGGVAKTLVLDFDSSSLLPYLLDYTQPLQHLSVIAASHQGCHLQLLIRFPSLPIFRHSVSWLHNVRKLGIRRNTLSTENINNYALHHLNRANSTQTHSHIHTHTPN